MKKITTLFLFSLLQNYTAKSQCSVSNIKEALSYQCPDMGIPLQGAYNGRNYLGDACRNLNL
jgi:hypothetical protein